MLFLYWIAFTNPKHPAKGVKCIFIRSIPIDLKNNYWYSNNLNPPWGESRGLVVKGEDSQLSGCGFESRRCILDGVSEASYYNEKGNKGSQIRQTKKEKKKLEPVVVTFATIK
jgi:hypothetical protein